LLMQARRQAKPGDKIFNRLACFRPAKNRGDIRLPRRIHWRIPAHHRMQHEAGSDAMRHAARGTQNIAKPMAGADRDTGPATHHRKPSRLLA
jgi:hypothetical protein